MQLKKSVVVEGVLERARNIAESKKYDCVQSQHLLMALLEDSGSAARELLAHLQISAAIVENIVIACTECEQARVPGTKVPEIVVASFSAKAKTIQNQAEALVVKNNYKNMITTAHYLLACLSVDCFARTILLKNGVSFDDVEKALSNSAVLGSE